MLAVLAHSSKLIIRWLQVRSVVGPLLKPQVRGGFFTGCESAVVDSQL